MATANSTQTQTPDQAAPRTHWTGADVLVECLTRHGVEVVFAYPGLGRLIYDAVAARDYPLLQGAILLIAFIFLTINLLVDVLYAIIDPRIRIS